MNTIIKISPKNMLSALIGATITYCAISLFADNDSEQQRISMLENKVQELELLLAQKDDELVNVRMFGFENTVASNKLAGASANVASKGSDNQTAESNQALGMSNPTPQEQILKDLVTLSDRDPRSFSVKVNELLAGNSSVENIAIVSKSVFDLAESREVLPDHELAVIYGSQTNPDLKRVVAQVASARGDNSLMEKQIVEAQTGLRSTDPAVQQKTLVELAKTRHVSAANAIAPLLQDKNNSVKLDALLALRATGNQSHIGLVEPLVNDPDPSVRWLANDVIENLQNLSDKARTKLASSDIMAELPIIPASNI